VVLKVSGNVQVFGYQVADGFFQYRSDNTIDFGFNVNLDFTIALIEGHLLGWIEARQPLPFNVDGSRKVARVQGTRACLFWSGGELLPELMVEFGLW
jgi:hypothetical protein